MRIKRPKNTKERGMIEFFFYKKGGKYIGACLTFDIVEEGESLREVEQSILEAAELHLDVVKKRKLPDKLLNRYAPKEYWDKYFKLHPTLRIEPLSR